MDSSGALRHDRKSKRRSFTGGKTGNSGSVTCPVQEMVLRIITVKQLFDKTQRPWFCGLYKKTLDMKHWTKRYSKFVLFSILAPQYSFKLYLF